MCFNGCNQILPSCSNLFVVSLANGTTIVQVRMIECYKASVKDVGHTVCSWKLRPPTKSRRSFFALGGALLVDESAVRPLFCLAVPSSALGETWSASSQARNVLMARENPRERRRARGGVKQVLFYYMIGRHS